MSGATLGAPVSLIYLFRYKAKKVPYFSLSFAISEYERRNLGAPVSLIYLFRYKAKKVPYFSLSFAISEYERRTLPPPLSFFLQLPSILFSPSPLSIIGLEISQTFSTLICLGGGGRGE